MSRELRLSIVISAPISKDAFEQSAQVEAFRNYVAGLAQLAAGHGGSVDVVSRIVTPKPTAKKEKAPASAPLLDAIAQAGGDVGHGESAPPEPPTDELALAAPMAVPTVAEINAALEPMADQAPADIGTEGQDREDYSDTQDRVIYAVEIPVGDPLEGLPPEAREQIEREQGNVDPLEIPKFLRREPQEQA
jgi:hypothetical protein